jgi:hypothetical protein
VRLSVVLDGGVVFGDVEQVRLEQVDPSDSTGRVIGTLRILDLMTVRGVVMVLVTVVLVTVVVPVTVVPVTVVSSSQAWSPRTRNHTTDKVTYSFCGIRCPWRSGHTRASMGIGGRHRIAGHRRTTGRARDLL